MAVVLRNFPAAIRSRQSAPGIISRRSAGSRWGTSRGVSLVEAMVAVLVLSMGLIGLAGLQISGLRFNRDAFLRSQATVLAYDVIEQMRIDRPNAMAGNYTATYNMADSLATCDAVASIARAAAVTCWQVALRDRIPGGVLTIAGPAAVGASTDQFTVTVSWVDTWRRESAGADPDQIQSISSQVLVFRL